MRGDCQEFRLHPMPYALPYVPVVPGTPPFLSGPGCSEAFVNLFSRYVAYKIVYSL